MLQDLNGHSMGLPADPSPYFVVVLCRSGRSFRIVEAHEEVLVEV